MTARFRFILSVLSVLTVFTVGTAGYMVIAADHTPTVLQAAYMTAITISTVGFEEVWDLSPHGQMWTMGVIIFGIGTVSIAFTSLVTLFVSGELRSQREREKMDSAIDQMSDHVILCGFGRMGALAAMELGQRNTAIVVIEVNPTKEQDIREHGWPYVLGDATDEECLRSAGIERAKALVAALPHDADNVFITLTAHAIRADLQIVARAEQPATTSKLKTAGATQVVCSQAIGAARVANVLTRPNVVDFFEVAQQGVDLEMEELRIKINSPLVGQTLRESALRERTGASIVAVMHADGKTEFNPGPEARLEAQDTLIIVGPAGVARRLDDL